MLVILLFDESMLLIGFASPPTAAGDDEDDDNGVPETVAMRGGYRSVEVLMNPRGGASSSPNSDENGPGAHRAEEEDASPCGYDEPFTLKLRLCPRISGRIFLFFFFASLTLMLSLSLSLFFEKWICISLSLSLSLSLFSRLKATRDALQRKENFPSFLKL